MEWSDNDLPTLDEHDPAAVRQTSRILDTVVSNVAPRDATTKSGIECDCLCLTSEFVRKHYVGLHSFRSMRRMGDEAEERERLAVEAFPVLGQPSAAAEPSKGAFADPALGQNDEGRGLSDRLTISTFTRQSSSDGGLKSRPLKAAVGKEPGQERKGAEQGRHQRRATVAVLDVGGERPVPTPAIEVIVERRARRQVLGTARHWQPVLRTYVRPLTTSRSST